MSRKEGLDIPVELCLVLLRTVVGLGCGVSYAYQSAKKEEEKTKKKKSSSKKEEEEEEEKEEEEEDVQVFNNLPQGYTTYPEYAKKAVRKYTNPGLEYDDEVRRWNMLRFRRWDDQLARIVESFMAQEVTEGQFRQDLREYYQQKYPYREDKYGRDATDAQRLVDLPPRVPLQYAAHPDIYRRGRKGEGGGGGGSGAGGPADHHQQSHQQSSTTAATATSATTTATTNNDTAIIHNNDKDDDRTRTTTHQQEQQQQQPKQQRDPFAYDADHRRLLDGGEGRHVSYPVIVVTLPPGAASDPRYSDTDRLLSLIQRGIYDQQTPFQRWRHEQQRLVRQQAKVVYERGFQTFGLVMFLLWGVMIILQLCFRVGP